MYQKLQQQGKEFEVVFVTADRSKSQFEVRQYGTARCSRGRAPAPPGNLYARGRGAVIFFREASDFQGPSFPTQPSQEYFAQMPWLAVPFDDASLQRRLSERFGVQGIPRLVILGPDGAVVAHDARAAVMADRAGAGFPWAGAAGPTGLAGRVTGGAGVGADARQEA